MVTNGNFQRVHEVLHPGRNCSKTTDSINNTHEHYNFYRLRHMKMMLMMIASVCTKYCILAALLLTFLPGDLTYVIVAGLFLVMKVVV